jgi:hypothetical protein
MGTHAVLGTLALGHWLRTKRGVPARCVLGRAWYRVDLVSHPLEVAR